MVDVSSNYVVRFGTKGAALRFDDIRSAALAYIRITLAGVPAVLLEEHLMGHLVLASHGEVTEDEATRAIERYMYALGRIDAHSGLHFLGPADAARFATTTGTNDGAGVRKEWEEFERCQT